MSLRLAEKCRFLFQDSALSVNLPQVAPMPSNNNFLAYYYAETLDKILDFSIKDQDCTCQALIFQRMMAHTCKHVLHKYKRVIDAQKEYKFFAIDGKTNTRYCEKYREYPITQDITALKREVILRTSIVYNDEKLETSLRNIFNAVMGISTLYPMAQFQEDFASSIDFWNCVVEYMKNQKDLKNNT
ncbi:unnamed protein product [Blepharisma stoltei]|uniref:SWIM-type domain-containing protein n=1 Tax=Blepharisma stoltei TaxID=1481888 RepID=A0AAU9JZG1_9CILI|nr:unnamed protein product [Blepharisma stoltei]